MRAFQVVQNWKPRRCSRRTISLGVTRIVNRLVVKQHKSYVEVRSPIRTLKSWYNRSQKSSEPGWHQDLTNKEENHNYILFWSNNLPTEIRNKQTKKSLRVRPGDVVVFDNTEFEHRMPRRKPINRWFARHIWGHSTWKRRRLIYKS